MSAIPATQLGTDLAVPATLNIGSGKDFRTDCFNLDYSEYWNPDMIADLSDRSLIGRTVETERFGTVVIERGMFDKIICNDVVEHIPDLVSAMSNCLHLLRDGGTMEILVPYDLSFGAWQDPTHVRAFNERSWLYYTEWFWYLGWTEARFHLRTLNYNLSDTGQMLRQGGMMDEVLLRAPRAVDSMFVVLERQPLSAEDRAKLDQVRGRSDV
jgi:SAM-dependent methyltransferase